MWFGHVKRRDQDYVGRKTMEMVPPGRRRRGRPRWMDSVNRVMRAIGTTKDEVHDRTGRRIIVSPTIKWERLEEEHVVGRSIRARQLMMWGLPWHE